MTHPLDNIATANSSRMAAFIDAMRLPTPAERIVRQFGDYAIANRDAWAREQVAADLDARQREARAAYSKTPTIERDA